MEGSSVKLPKAGERNILVTSALPYVNNLPHLGNIIGSVLSADVFARFCRLRGYNVLFVCGTDEYGTSTEVRAAKENVLPREICDKYHPLHKEVYQWFDISFDQFGRTSTDQHTVVCHQVFNSLFQNNLLAEDTIEQLYCQNCLKFLADSFVEGHCPHCRGSCKGDQCEDCSAHLNARDLLDPICKICQSSTPTLRSTEHLFLQLATVQQDVHALSERIYFSNDQALTDTQNLVCLDNKLPPKCITRDLKWGVPVPVEKFKDKVMYVWFDAPLGYISITKCHTSEWELWWKNPQNVELHQFMGKDNVSFHSAHFPSYLIGTGENWTLPHSIHATHFLLFGAGKFSKSRGIGIFGDEVKDTNIPVEVWRYYLVSVRPETSDSRFSWEDLQAKLNSELTDNLGNFMNRVLTFVAKPLGKGYNSIVPDVPDAVLNEIDNKFGDSLKGYVQEYVKCLEKVLKQLKLEASVFTLHDEDIERAQKPWEIVPAGHRIGKPCPLFRKLSDDDINELEKEFCGSQTERHENVVLLNKSEHCRSAKLLRCYQSPVMEVIISEGSKSKKFDCDGNIDEKGVKSLSDDSIGLGQNFSGGVCMVALPIDSFQVASVSNDADVGMSPIKEFQKVEQNESIVSTSLKKERNIRKFWCNLRFRFHWDFSTVMVEWSNPFDDTIAQSSGSYSDEYYGFPKFEEYGRFATSMSMGDDQAIYAVSAKKIEENPIVTDGLWLLVHCGRYESDLYIEKLSPEGASVSRRELEFSDRCADSVERNSCNCWCSMLLLLLLLCSTLLLDCWCCNNVLYADASAVLLNATGAEFLAANKQKLLLL
uniref:methionine--tRNA ligase n=1 Tax=Chenopodium quinoa TaxID=63459 RepID=A0A803MGT3_CHEQI